MQRERRSGVAIFDFDFDGRTDVYLVNGGWVEEREAPPGRLYRNVGEEGAGKIVANYGPRLPNADYEALRREFFAV